MPMPVPRPSVASLVAVAAFGLSACGGSSEQAGSAGGSSQAEHPAQPAADAGMQHIHGLGVRGTQLVIATHTGLFTTSDEQAEPRRLGASRQDVMGFSVLKDGRFIGSGHPAPDQSAPANLGLIESRDGGRTWQNISLEGDADFHTLETSGRRVYGFDGTQGRLMVSSDAGRTWDQRQPPAAIFSLAIDPGSADRFVTSTERGLFVSDDAGQRFRPLELRGELAGLLAWPSTDQLYLVDGRGQVLRSDGRATHWQPVGSIDGQPAAFEAHGPELYAALADNTIKRSTDGGRTWAVRATPRGDVSSR